MERMKIADIKTRAPFEDLFPVKEEVVQAIGKHIENNGYDESTPIVIWKEGEVVGWPYATSGSPESQS